jgi:hypothetical protein
MLPYKTLFPPLTNGQHYSYLDRRVSKSHLCRYIRGRYKIILTFNKICRLREVFTIYYYAHKNFAIVKNYQANTFNKKYNKSTKDMVYQYFNDFITNKVKIVFVKSIDIT